MSPIPLCDYCGNPSEKVTGQVIYPNLKYLWKKTFYRCVPCKAHVGCHPGTARPLGGLANAALRSAKSRVHALFDPLWKSGRMARQNAYAWLAEGLGIEKKDCHVGMFDLERCRQATAFIMKNRGF